MANQLKIVMVSVLIIIATITMVLSQTEKRTCTIKQLVGSVKIRRGATVKWLDARPRMPLKENDAVRTLLESEVTLETSEGSLLKIGENSTVAMTVLKGSAQNSKTKVRVMDGAIVANVKKLVSSQSSFEFETPTATAAIRGTVVGIDVSNKQTSVKVYEGKVYVTPHGSQQGVELQQNQMGTVVKGNDGVSVKKLDEKIPISLSPGGESDTTKPPVKDSLSTNDTTKVNDSTKTVQKDTTTQSLAPASTASLQLSLNTPAEGAVITMGAQITVSGFVAPLSATVTVNGKVVQPAATGAFKVLLQPQAATTFSEIIVGAKLNGNTKSITRRVTVKNDALQFTLIAPLDGQVFVKPSILVSGIVSAGAEVRAMSVKLSVASTGTFSGIVPIANEAGDFLMEFEASLGGKTQKITRRIVYKPDYRFTLTTPADRQVVTATLLQVTGEVLPANAEVSVMGRRLSVSNSGKFNGFITIPPDEGEVTLDFDIVSGNLTKNETRKIIFKKPADTYRPQLQASVAGACWNVTVIDRTIDDEITLWYEVDGSKESRTMTPNESYCLPLEEGIHSYRAYAEDRERNKTTVEQLTKYPYLATASWIIQMRSPAGNVTIDLPPSTPDGNYKPRYTIEFSIENLPNDNIEFVKEITILNKATGENIALRSLTDIFIENEIGIAPRKINQIIIEVRDINNVIKTKLVQIKAQ